MTIYRGTYYSAQGCDSSARSGTNALMSWYLGAYVARKAANLGTYACKGLGSGWSIHAERRAADMGTAPYGGVDSTWGWALANALRLHSAELGIQCLILGRKIWSCTYPDAGWRNYTGEYHGHIHVELTPNSSRTLTVAKIQAALTEGRPPTNGGTNVALTAAQDKMLKALDDRGRALIQGDESHLTSWASDPNGTEEIWPVLALKGLQTNVQSAHTKLDALANPIDYDLLAGKVADAIMARVVALLPPPTE